jgi:hypothetical protein
MFELAAIVVLPLSVISPFVLLPGAGFASATEYVCTLTSSENPLAKTVKLHIEIRKEIIRIMVMIFCV